MAWYNLSDAVQVKQARTYLDKLVQGGKQCQIVNKKPRSSNQNRYLHSLFALWGLEYGYNLEEAKTTVKRSLNYTYEKNGTAFLVQTSRMTTAELTTFIDKFRNWSAENGLYLPSSDEFNGKYADYMKEIDRHKEYL